MFKSLSCYRTTLLCGVWLSSTSYAATSQVTDEQQDQNIEIIEVTSQNHYQSTEYQIINRDSFINRSQTLADVLQNINGIQIRQISGIGNPSAISIRGSTSKQVQVYIDGQLINDNQFGGFDLNQLPTAQIQSIEVSKNQAIGSGATPIGGAIRINTFNANKDTLRLSLEHGSFGFNQFNLTHNQVFDTHNLGLGYSFIKVDNDFDYDVPQSFNNPSESIIEPLKNNQYRKTSWYLNDEAQFGQHKIRVNLQHLDQNKALPNYQNNSPENHSRLETQSTRYGYQHNWQPQADSQDQLLNQIEFQLYKQDKDEQYHNIPGGPIERLGDYQSEQTMASIRPDFSIAQFSLTPYVEYQKQTFRSTSTTNGQPNRCSAITPCDIKATQKQTNWGSRINWQSIDDSLAAYLLFSQISQRNDNAAINDPSAQTLSNKKRYDSQEAAFSYTKGAFKSQLSIAKGIRTPTLFELFGDRGSFKGNDDLLAETATTYSLSSNYQQSDHQVKLSLYQQEQDNAIVAIFNSTGVGSYTNVAQSTVKGLEIQGSYQFNDSLNFVLQGNYIDSNSESDIVAFNNKKLPGLYHRQLGLGINYQILDDLTINWRTDIDQQLYFNRANRFENDQHSGNGTPADRVLNHLTVNWQYHKYNINLAINNLFNQQYQDLANRQAQGRSIQLKLSFEVF